jgi:hypothetical protein
MQNFHRTGNILDCALSKSNKQQLKVINSSRPPLNPYTQLHQSQPYENEACVHKNYLMETEERKQQS